MGHWFCGYFGRRSELEREDMKIMNPGAKARKQLTAPLLSLCTAIISSVFYSIDTL
jgi:hypothetical protein